MLDDRPFHEVHPELFHYTCINGVKGILRSQSLWGTHWKHLNDAGELKHFSEKLSSLLKAARFAAAEEFARNRADFKEWINSQGGIEKVIDTEVQGLVRVFQNSVVQPDPEQQVFEFYVTSFCTPEGSFEEVRTHGLLSMWRSYAEGGYALVFDTAKLDRLLRMEAEAWPSRMELGDVGYSCDPPDVLDSRISALPELRKKFSDSMFDSPEAFETMPYAPHLLHTVPPSCHPMDESKKRDIRCPRAKKGLRRQTRIVRFPGIPCQTKPNRRRFRQMGNR